MLYLNHKNNLIIQKIDNPELIKAAKSLSNTGIVQQDGNYTYLKISDDFIHKLHPLIRNNKHLQKPNYFSEKCSIGTHITIIYPNEDIVINNQDVSILHSFEIDELIKTRIENKEYYALTVSSPSLDLLRKKYRLPSELNFKGYNIGFHITIATYKL